MIKAVRSVLLCERMEQEEGGRANYLGVMGETLWLNSSPNLFAGWLTLMLELDRRATQGRIQIEAADYRNVVSSKLPAGWWLAPIAFPVMIPVREDGPLTVSIFDGVKTGTPYRFKWRFEFMPGAEILPDEAWAEAVALSADTTQLMGLDLDAQGDARH
jgi:hypothetical protein